MLLVLAYPMTFTVRAYAISGRETRVHFAAILGASILFALFIKWITYILQRYTRRNIAMVIVAPWLALLVGFGQIVQLDYQASWENQISFWDQLVLIAPDLEKGTVILVDPAGLRDTKYIGSNTWNLPRILEQIYSFPESWGKYDIPRVYRLTPDWEQYILGEEGVLHLNARTTVAPRSYDRAVDPAQVIYLTSEDNQLARVTGSLTINDTSLGLKISTPDPQPAYEPSVLDSLLTKQAQ